MIIQLQEAINTEVNSPKPLYALLKQFLNTLDSVDADKEHFIAIHLNARNKIQIMEVVSVGTLNASLVHPREVFTRAIAIRSAQLILAHNHPSGNFDPSDADIAITKRLVEAGTLLGIEVIDHMVFTKDGYCSFKEKGMI